MKSLIQSKMIIPILLLIFSLAFLITAVCIRNSDRYTWLKTSYYEAEAEYQDILDREDAGEYILPTLKEACNDSRMSYWNWYQNEERLATTFITLAFISFILSIGTFILFKKIGS